MSKSRVNAYCNEHHRSCTIDMPAHFSPAAERTVSPVLIDSDTCFPMVPLEVLEDIMAAAIDTLATHFCHTEPRYGPLLWSYVQGHRRRLAQDLDEWCRQSRTIRDTQECNKIIEQQRARIEVLEAEVVRLKQEEADLVNVYEEQDLATMQDLDDIYQLVLDMERDVKEAESSRVQLKAKYNEERACYLALEEDLEAGRLSTFEQPRCLQADYRCAVLRAETDKCLSEGVSALRADVDMICVEMDAIKIHAGTVCMLAEDKSALQACVEMLERQLHGQELLAMGVQKIELAEPTRLTAERDEAQKTVDLYAKQRWTSKNRPSSHAKGLTTDVEKHTTIEGEAITTPQARSSGPKEAVDAYRSLSMALVNSLTLEHDLLRGQKAMAETEKAKRLKAKLCEADRCRQDEYNAYRQQWMKMKANITKLTLERDAAIETRDHSDAILVDISSQAVLDQGSCGTTRGFRRRHERAATIKASMVTQERPHKVAMNSEALSDTSEGLADKWKRETFTSQDLDGNRCVVSQSGKSSGGEWTKSNEQSFNSDDFGGTSTLPPKFDLGVSKSDEDMSFGSDGRMSVAEMVSPLTEGSVCDSKSDLEESSSDAVPSSLVGLPSTDLELDPLEFRQHRASSTTRDMETSKHLSNTEGQLCKVYAGNDPLHPPTSEVGSPGPSAPLALANGSGSRHTSSCSSISDPSAHRIRNTQETRAVVVIQDSHNRGLLPSSWPDRRAFEPP